MPGDLSRSVSPLYHWYEGYSEPENSTEPPVGTVALCGHVRSADIPADLREHRNMRDVDELSCMKCVRLRLAGHVEYLDEYSDDELREALGDA